MKSLNGSELAGFIKERQAKQVRALRQASYVNPKLAIVQTKDDPVINTYVRLKKQYGADIQVDVETYMLAQNEIANKIKSLNNDKSIHGIIVQLPLSDTAQTEEIVNQVDPAKDVDALGDPNLPWPAHLDAVQGSSEKRSKVYEKVQRTSTGATDTAMCQKPAGMAGSAGQQGKAVRGSWFSPATPMAIMWLLAGYNIDLRGKHILLIGRGRLVGAPLEKMLLSSGYDVEVIGREALDLAKHTKYADVIITATGSPAILYSKMIKQGAVVVDAGVASESGKTVGDLDDDVYERDDLTLTPRKGGVGPLTVCALFDNVIRAASQSLKI